MRRRPRRLGLTRVSGNGRCASCSHGGVVWPLFITDSPFVARGVWSEGLRPACGYSGEAAIPKRGRLEGVPVPPRGPSVSPFAYRTGLPWGTRELSPATLPDDVGLSLVSMVCLCEQVTSPDTSEGRRDEPSAASPETKPRDGGGSSRCFSTVRNLAHRPRPNRDPSRPVPAWPPRRRPLPPDAGCVPLLAAGSSKDF